MVSQDKKKYIKNPETLLTTIDMMIYMGGKNYVIGGGLSAASFCYFGKKYENIILEKEPRLNGRIKSLLIDNNAIEIGAQFFCREDKAIYNLVKELKFENKLQRVNLHNFSVLHDKKIIKLKDNISEGASKEEKKELKKFYSFLENEAIDMFINPSTKLYFDGFDEWYKQNIGENTEWIITSLVRSITFSEPKDLSAFYGLLVCSTFFEPCYSIEGGLELLNEKLFSIAKPKIMKKNQVTKLTLKDTKVTEMELNHNKKIRIGEKDSVISTIPSKELVKILPSSSLKEQLNKIEYNGCGVTFLKTRKRFMTTGSGILYAKNTGISAIIDESGYVGFNSLKGNIVVLRPYRMGEKKIFEKTMEEIKRLFPNIEKDIESIEFFNWDCGLPVASPNLFSLHKKLHQHEMDNFYFCGDYMGLPSLDACVESSKIVAEKIKNKM